MEVKLTVILATAMLAAACAPVAPVAQAAPAKRGEMTAVMVKKGPALDGVGREGVWATCPPMALGECTTDKPGILKTSARVLFGATKMYVSFDCAEPDVDALVAKTTRRDGNVWADDCVEVFVTGDSRVGMFHFAVNPKGTIFDSKGKDAKWDSGATTKVAVEKGKGWTVTLAVPLKGVGAYVGKGQTWVLNLNRTKPGSDPSRPAGEWSWAVMGGNDYHQAMDYGRVTGVTVPKRGDGVTREATAPPPPPSFDKGKQAGSVLVYRRYGDVTLKGSPKGLGRTFACNIRNSPGLKLAFLATPSGAVNSIPLNMADKRSNDNTTPNGYRTFVAGRPLPIIYFVDRFRYNAVMNSKVGRNTHYTNVRFHSGGAAEGASVALTDLTVYRGEDTTPPAAPTALKTKATDEGVELSWQRAADNVGIALYAVSRAGGDGTFAKIGEAFGPGYVDRPGAAGKYRYRMLAVDFQGNLSPWSKTASVTASKGTAPTKPEGIDANLAADRAAYAERIRKVHAAGVGKVRRGWVMAFGDSLTYALSYGHAVEAHLGRYRVTAKGYPGQRTGFGRKKIDADLKAVNPEFCLILLGTNNSKSDKALPLAMADIKAMVTSCERRGTVPIVATIPPRGFRDPASKPEARYNAELITTCRAEKIPLCYLFEYFQSLPDRRKLLAGDGVHWQGEGFPATGRIWKRAMDQVNFVLLDRP